MNKKPDFKSSVAAAFMGGAPAEDPTPAPLPESEKAPEGMKLNPAYIEKYIEKKTRRVQIVLQPSLYEKAKAKAKEQGKSFNDYVHGLLESDIK